MGVCQCLNSVHLTTCNMQSIRNGSVPEGFLWSLRSSVSFPCRCGAQLTESCRGDSPSKRPTRRNVVSKRSNTAGEGQRKRREFTRDVVGQVHSHMSYEDVLVALFSIPVAIFLWLCIPTWVSTYLTVVAVQVTHIPIILFRSAFASCLHYTKICLSCSSWKSFMDNVGYPWSWSL